jgi:phospholipase C
LARAATSGPTFGPNSRDSVTHMPIKHVIIIIGENRTFDNVFAAYKPVSSDTVWNLLSEKIVNPDGTPGSNYLKARQSSATDTSKRHTIRMRGARNRPHTAGNQLQYACQRGGGDPV